MNTTYILRGVSADGSEYFYTGRAGAGWVSQSVPEAFAYDSLDSARSKAALFNQRMALHGLRFIAVPEVVWNAI